MLFHFRKATYIARNYHTPVLVHVQELTQPRVIPPPVPHERYKSKRKIGMGKQYDCLTVMTEWLKETRNIINTIQN